MCLRYTMRPASAILGGVLGRNFVNPKYFFLYFVISSFVYEPKRVLSA